MKKFILQIQSGYGLRRAMLGDETLLSIDCTVVENEVTSIMY